MSETIIRGSIPEIIRNDANVYEGNLIHYFWVLFHTARNVNHPYHNFRHMLHVTWMCHDACVFYEHRLNKREKRNLLIAALFHDFDHSGTRGDDDLNIARALRGLDHHIMLEDKAYLPEITRLIKATQYPHLVPGEDLHLLAQILRDADLSQALSSTWIQEVVFGLAAEWRQTPYEVLRAQLTFQQNLRFYSEWAKLRFPQSLIQQKENEIKEMIALTK